MNRKICIILLAASAPSFVLPAPTQAETVNVIADLQNSKRTVAYINSDPMIQTLYRLGAEQDKRLGLQADCKSRPQVKLVNFILLAPIDFPSDKQHPIKGIWQLRYQFERCGAPKIYNAAFMANPNGEPPKSQAYFPGSPGASVSLIKDAMRSALISALFQSGRKDCKDVDVFDMRVSAQPHDVVEGEKTVKGVWKEIWTLKVCGQLIDVPITFLPDATGGGTTFTTSMQDEGGIRGSFSDVPAVGNPAAGAGFNREDFTPVAASLIAQGDEAREQRKFDDAKALYQKALAGLGSEPISATALIHLGTLELATKNFAQAADDFERAQTIDSTRASEVGMWMAIGQQLQNKPSAARELYRGALTADDPNSTAAATILELYADLLLTQGHPDEASTMHTRADAIRTAQGAQAASRSQADNPDVYRIGGGVSAPTLLSKVQPEYTQEARIAQYQGKVVLSIEVDVEGFPRNIEVIRALGFGLDRKASEAVRQWRFRPGVKDGLPVRTRAQVEVNFKLSDEASKILERCQFSQLSAVTTPPPAIRHARAPTGDPA